MKMKDEFYADLLQSVKTAKQEYEIRKTLLETYEVFLDKRETLRTSKGGMGPSEPKVVDPVKSLTSNVTSFNEEAKTQEEQPVQLSSESQEAEEVQEENEPAPEVSERQKSTLKAAEPATVKTSDLDGSKPGPKAGTKREIPSLVQGIKTILGTKTLNADQVFEELKERGWLPNSNDPKGYVRYTLSSKKEIFLRAEGRRGFYHLEGGVAAAKPVEMPPVRKEELSFESEPLSTPEEQAEISQTVSEVEALLKRSGIDLSGENPFASP